jgi:hypothetical protein
MSHPEQGQVVARATFRGQVNFDDYAGGLVNKNGISLELSRLWIAHICGLPSVSSKTVPLQATVTHCLDVRVLADHVHEGVRTIYFVPADSPRD